MDIQQCFKKKPADKVDGPKGPLPILKVPDQVDQPFKHYMLRITPQNRFTRAQLTQFLNKTFCEWILGQEDSKKSKLHYHVVIMDDDPLPAIRDSVLEFLYIYWQKHERGRGWGHQYNLQTIENLSDSIAYTIKDNNYEISDGINDSTIQELYHKSFQKYSKDDFQREFDKIAADYKVQKDMSMSDFMRRFIILKAKYRQPIKMSYIYEVALSHEVHRDNSYAERLVDAYLYKIEH